jgi:D-alanyl-D-alanine carboxypeptidase
MGSRRSRRMAGRLTLALTLLSAVGDVPQASAQPVAPVNPRLLRTIELLGTLGAPGVIVVRQDGDRTFRVARGYSDVRRKTPMRAADRFRVGSVTKTFVATIVLQLVGEGKLSLDATVAERLPGLVPQGGAITIRELLNHTSGLFDYIDDKRVLEPYQHGNRRYRWEPRRLVSIALSHAPLFQPGASWSYSNTNYILLGLIIEAATGRSIGAELRHRIFEPLELRHTTFDTQPVISGTRARGYGIVDDPPVQDLSVFSPSFLWAAGAIVSTADDLATFYRALLQGRLLGPDTLHAMETVVPLGSEGYGLGLSRVRFACSIVWGHAGDSPGYRTSIYASKDGRRIVVVVVNRNPMSGWAQSVFQDVVETAYCGYPNPSLVG